MDCPAIEVEYSDKAGTGDITGSTTETVTVTCDNGYASSDDSANTFDVSCDEAGSLQSTFTGIQTCVGRCWLS